MFRDIPRPSNDVDYCSISTTNSRPRRNWCLGALLESTVETSAVVVDGPEHQSSASQSPRISTPEQGPTSPNDTTSEPTCVLQSHNDSRSSSLLDQYSRSVYMIHYTIALSLCPTRPRVAQVLREFQVSNQLCIDSFCRTIQLTHCCGKGSTTRESPPFPSLPSFFFYVPSFHFDQFFFS